MDSCNQYPSIDSASKPFVAALAQLTEILQNLEWL